MRFCILGKGSTVFFFPSFSLISQVLRKGLKENIDHLVKFTPTWQSHPWYTQRLKISAEPPFLLPQIKNY